MNENEAILGVSTYASNFCNAYTTFGNEMTNFSTRLQNLQKDINEKAQKYNIDLNEQTTVASYFDRARTHTLETYYNSLEDSEKFQSIQGQPIPFDLLNDSQKVEIQAGFDEMNKNYIDSALQVIQMQADIRRVEDDLKELVEKNSERMNNMYRMFEYNESILDDNIRRLDVEKVTLTTKINMAEFDDSLANKEEVINNYRQQMAVCDAKQLILNSVSRASNVYKNIFKTINSKMIDYKYASDEKVSTRRREMINEELTIAAYLKGLIDDFSTIKSNYDAEKEKIEQINVSVEMFSRNYITNGTGILNARDFVAGVRKATSYVTEAIEKIEKNQELDKVKENGNVFGIDPQPMPQPKPADSGDNQDDQNNREEENDLRNGQNNDGNLQDDQNNRQEENDLRDGQNNDGNSQDDQNNRQEENDLRDDQNNDGNTGDGQDDEFEDDLEEENELANNDPVKTGVDENIAKIMKQAKRVRGVRHSKELKFAKTTAALALGAAALGFLPPLAPIQAGLWTGAAISAGMSLGYPLFSSALSDIVPFAKYKATSHKLKSIARKVTKQFNKNNKKSGIKFKVRPLPETGEIRFAIVKDGVDVGLIDSRTTGVVIGDGYSLDQAEISSVVGMFQELLDKNFKKFNDNKKRGDYQKKYNIPPVTVDNLPVLYTEFGGYNFNLEGEQFGVVDTVKYRKAHKEGKGIKNMFKNLKKKIGVNKTTDDDLEEVSIRNANSGDGADIGLDVNEDELDDLNIVPDVIEGPIQNNDGQGREENIISHQQQDNHDLDNLFKDLDEEVAHQREQDLELERANDLDSFNNVPLATIYSFLSAAGLNESQIASYESGLASLDAENAKKLLDDLAVCADEQSIITTLDSYTAPGKNKTLNL